MTAALLDADVLIALVVRGHVHEEAATRWLAGVDEFAVCPIVEGALVRYLLRTGESSATAHAALASVRALPSCSFRPDDLSYADAELGAVRGHRQVTDAYLVALAAVRGGVLATFDEAVIDARPDLTVRPTPLAPEPAG